MPPQVKSKLMAVSLTEPGVRVLMKPEPEGLAKVKADSAPI